MHLNRILLLIGLALLASVRSASADPIRPASACSEIFSGRYVDASNGHPTEIKQTGCALEFSGDNQHASVLLDGVLRRGTGHNAGSKMAAQTGSGWVEFYYGWLGETNTTYVSTDRDGNLLRLQTNCKINPNTQSTDCESFKQFRWLNKVN